MHITSALCSGFAMIVTASLVGNIFIKGAAQTHLFSPVILHISRSLICFYVFNFNQNDYNYNQEQILFFFQGPLMKTDTTPEQREENALFWRSVAG